MAEQPVFSDNLLQKSGDEPLEEVLDDFEAINSNQNESIKKRRFHPLRAVRKIFRRRTSKGSLKDEEAIMKSRSTSELLEATDRGSNCSSGDDRQINDKPQILYSAGLSLSHDSIFSPENTNIGQGTQGHAESNQNVQKLTLKNIKDELTAKLRLRSEDEDAVFLRSPQYTNSTVEFLLQEFKVQRSLGNVGHSDGGHLSTGSSDADSGQSSLHSSQVCVVEKKLENSDPDLDIGTTTLLSNEAARHKLSIKPKRTRTSMGHRMLQQTASNHSTQLSASAVLPTTPEDEESEDSPQTPDSVFSFGTSIDELNYDQPEPFELQSVTRRSWKVEERITERDVEKIHVSETFYGEVAVIERKEVKVEEEIKKPKPENIQEQIAKKADKARTTEIRDVQKVEKGNLVKKPEKEEDVDIIKVSVLARKTVKDRNETPRDFEKLKEIQVSNKSVSPKTAETKEVVTEKIKEKKVVEVNATKWNENVEQPKEVEFGYGSDDDDEGAGRTTCFQIGRHRNRKSDLDVHAEKRTHQGGDAFLSKIFGSRRSARKKKLEEKSAASQVTEETSTVLKTTARQVSVPAENIGGNVLVQSWGERKLSSESDQSKYRRAVSMEEGRAELVSSVTPVIPVPKNDVKVEKKPIVVSRSVSATENGIVARLSRNFEQSLENVVGEPVQPENILTKSASQGKLVPEKPRDKDVDTKDVKVGPSGSEKIPSKAQKAGLTTAEDNSDKVFILPRVSLSPSSSSRRKLRQRAQSPTKSPIKSKSEVIEEHIPDLTISSIEEIRRKASDPKRRPIQHQLSNDEMAELESFPRTRQNSNDKEAVAKETAKTMEVITITPPPVIRTKKGLPEAEPPEVAQILKVKKLLHETSVSPEINPAKPKETDRLILAKGSPPVSATRKENIPEDIDRTVQSAKISDAVQSEEVVSHPREDNNNTLILDKEPDLQAKTVVKLRNRPSSQTGSLDQSELMRVFFRRSLKLKDDEIPNMESVVVEKSDKQVPDEVKPVSPPPLNCPPEVVELPGTIEQPQPAETSPTSGVPQWMKVAQLRREQRQKESKDKSISDATHIIIPVAAKTVSRSSKVLDIVNTFQKLQVT